MAAKFLIPTFLLCLSIGEAFSFTPRNASHCQVLNSEMAEWFQEAYANPKKESYPPIEKYLGPIKNQKVGWCFAYTAADLLSEASGYQISGAQVAQNYYSTNFKAQIRTLFVSNKEGGSTKDALNKALELPLCEERDFSSAIYTSFEKAKKKVCERPVIEMDNYKVKQYSASGFYDGYTLFSKIDNILKDKRIAGIEYDHTQIIDDKLNQSEQTKANHASSIIARYFDKSDNSCRYIIRNSFGRTCKKSNSKRTKCAGGYYSVSEWQLNNMLTDVISLERR